MPKIKCRKNIIVLFCIVFVVFVLPNNSYAAPIENDALVISDTINKNDTLIIADTLSLPDTINKSSLPVIPRIDSTRLIRTKAEFILDIASQIVFPETASDSIYKIGIHGKSQGIRELYDTLVKISDSLFILERRVEVYFFKNTRSIRPVDLLYLNGESKIRIRDLNKKLEGYPYFMITENFPFGTSLLNFTVDEQSEMQFEIQDDVLAEKGALITKEILESPHRIRLEKKWGKILQKTKQQLENEKFKSETQEDIIVEQIEEIVEKEKLIYDQQKVIIVTILFITILTLLVLIIIRLSRQRKEALLVLKQKNKDITDSIRYAKYIQEAMLPSSERIANSFSDSCVLYLPKDIISGDFYWFKDLGSKKMLAVADCTGHGVPGAFLSIIGNELLSLFAESLGDMNPGELLELIDLRIAQSLNQESNQGADGMDIALISYNSDDGLLNYAGAYRPLIMVRNNELTVLKPTRSSVGGFNNKQTKRFANTQLETLPGDCFYMFSDGYQDQFGGQKGKKFMSRRLNNLIRDIHQLPLDEQKEKLHQTLLNWKGSEEQIDDISLIGFKI